MRAGIAAACKIARRKVEDVTLIAVTKGRAAEEIEPLIAAGQRDFGENRVQEAAQRWPAILARHPGLKLHMIGQLQSNKADDAVRLFDSIHSLDRPSLLAALIKAGEHRLVLLDELNIVLRYDYLPIEEVVAFLRDEKPADVHVVITADNAYSFGYGDVTGIATYVQGTRAVTAGQSP